MRASYGQVQIVGPPGWRRIPAVTRALLLITGVSYLTGLVYPPVLTVLAGDTEAILRGLQLWRLLTHPFVMIGIWNAIFGLLLLWTFGSELEPEWGSRKFALFLAVTALVSGIAGTATTLLPRVGPATGFGLSGLLAAIIVAWMLCGPNLPVYFFGAIPMTRKIFALIALVIVVFGEIESTRSLPRLLFILGGLPVAWMFSRSPSFPGRNPFRRSKLRIVRDGDNPYNYH